MQMIKSMLCERYFNFRHSEIEFSRRSYKGTASSITSHDIPSGISFLAVAISSGKKEARLSRAISWPLTELRAPKWSVHIQFHRLGHNNEHDSGHFHDSWKLLRGHLNKTPRTDGEFRIL
ncbi:hypothetical protein CEXT_536911 [Caerostris extrusa]|uniref:Uncharacterized protein n=1 Tax=Caerostris extrusa TaxID=172846 RepID=A0AAV4P1X8_CAEEX|nr:hypothetical protein CEXT_536911 [Caerostris extrusa]